MVNEALKLPFPDPPETYSTSDHLYEALDIPRTAKGTLPRDQRVRAGLAAEQVEDLGETGRRAQVTGRVAVLNTSHVHPGGSLLGARLGTAIGPRRGQRPPRTSRPRQRTRGGRRRQRFVEPSRRRLQTPVRPRRRQFRLRRRPPPQWRSSAWPERRRRRGGRGARSGDPASQGVAEAS